MQVDASECKWMQVNIEWIQANTSEFKLVDGNNVFKLLALSWCWFLLSSTCLLLTSVTSYLKQLKVVQSGNTNGVNKCILL